MAIKLAINGVGRIGRAAFKIAHASDQFEVVALNNLSGTKMLAHLLKYDTVYGRYEHEVTYDDEHVIVDGKKYRVYSEREPKDLPWQELEVDVVIESTGVFRTREKASAHLDAGAKRVVLSAPPKGTEVQSFVLGVNDDELGDDPIVSNASCTTNCIAPIVNVINDVFGIEKAMLTTIHAYTSSQNIVDNSHKKDMRRARAAAENLVPTTTGAAKATTTTIPDLKGKFDGMAIRVPIPVGSLSDITIVLKEEATEEQINQALKQAAATDQYQDILTCIDEPIVSSDIVGNPHASIVDLELTKVVGGNLAKVIAWYDNEWGYSEALVRLCAKVGNKIK